jgi:hypothetical protein
MDEKQESICGPCSPVTETKYVGADNRVQMVVMQVGQDYFSSEQADKIISVVKGKCKEAGWGDVPVMVMPDSIRPTFIQPVTFVLPSGCIVEHEKYDNYEYTIAYPIGQRPDLRPWQDNKEMQK